jgi:hypothetical protein
MKVNSKLQQKEVLKLEDFFWKYKVKWGFDIHLMNFHVFNGC